METKFNYGNGSSVDDFARRDIIRESSKITDNANYRVIPFMLAAGIKPTIENVLATSVKIEDLRDYFKQDYKEKHSDEVQSGILGDFIEERLDAKFNELYQQACKSRRADESFRSGSYLNPDHVQFYYLTANSEELRIDLDKIDRACSVELTAEEKPVFDKICQICDLLNELIEVQREVRPTMNSIALDDRWHRIIDCANKNDGKPAFRPSIPLRTDLLKIKF